VLITQQVICLVDVHLQHIWRKFRTPGLHAAVHCVCGSPGAIMSLIRHLLQHQCVLLEYGCATWTASPDFLILRAVCTQATDPCSWLQRVTSGWQQPPPSQAAAQVTGQGSGCRWLATS
jgi:hypothetical protein